MAKAISNKDLLPKLIRTYGKHCGDGKYVIHLSDMKLYIDGRFCDEFEDDTDFRKCIVNYIAVDGDDVEPWFNMQATGGMIGLVWGDKYCIENLGKDKEGRCNIAKVVKYIQNKYKNSAISETRKKHLRQAEWIEKTQKLNNKFFLRGYKKNYSGCDFIHAVDCIYCCGSNNEGWSLTELERKIINDIDKHAAFIIRLRFPTISALLKAGYLSRQSPERYARWQGIIRKINKRLNTRLPKSEFIKLFNSEFEDIFIDGRLYGEPMKSISKNKPKTIKYKERTSPNLGTHPDWNNVSWDERIAYSNKKRIEMTEAIKKLGHPRFEVVIHKDSMKHFVESQMKILHLMNFYNCKEKKFKNTGTAFCNYLSLPAVGVYIIDHLDEDKTPYLVGDLNKIINKFGVISGAFTKINDKIFNIRTISESQMRPADWQARDLGMIDNIYAKMYQNQLVDYYKNKTPEVSQRTGAQYMISSHKTIFEAESLCENYNMYEEWLKETFIESE